MPLLLDDLAQVVLGYELVFHDGTSAGYVMYGYALDASIAFTRFTAAAAVPGNTCADGVIRPAARGAAAVVAPEPLVDPGAGGRG